MLRSNLQHFRAFLDIARDSMRHGCNLKLLGLAGMRKFGGALLTGLLLTVPATAQFQLDMQAEEIRRAEVRPAVIDLAVGEAGLTLPRLCDDEHGSLFISGRTPLLETSMNFTVMARVKRTPGGTVVITSEVGTDASVDAREN
jgi:hypothetical protein